MEDMMTTPGDVPPPFLPPRAPAAAAQAAAPAAAVPSAPAPATQAAPAAVAHELPYPMAKRLRAQGMNDALIVAELQRTGLSEADAQFVIGSLPGGQFSRPAATVSSDTTNVGGEGLPLTGLAMMGLGILITFGSYASAAPGGTYVITWGLIVAGIVRIMRGR